MIPQFGDKVRLNPAGCVGAFTADLLRVFGETPLEFESASIGDPRSELTIKLKGVGKGYFQAKIITPDGRFHSSPEGTMSLFTWFSGLYRMPFVQGEKFPIPVPGDKVVLEGGAEHPVRACDCYGSASRNSWPYGNMRCGAHVDSFLVYNIDPGFGHGWTRDGTLIRSVVPSAAPVLDASALRIANMGAAARFCVACGSPLREPYPGLKHCPKCEP
jgi:hypothetical protein